MTSFVFGLLVSMTIGLPAIAQNTNGGDIGSMSTGAKGVSFELLEQMFSASQTPYAVDELAIQSNKVRSIFKGCAWVSKGDRISSVDVPIFAVNSTITSHDSAGPLQPVTVSTSLRVTNVNHLDSFIKLGAVIKNDGTLDFDRLTDLPLGARECSDGTSFKEMLRSTYSGLTQDGTAYAVQENCKRDGIASLLLLRKSGEYLVGQNTVRTNHGTRYFYCWK